MSKQINNDIQYESKFIKLKLADLNEAIIKRIQKTNTKQLIPPFYFNKKATTFYICNILPPRKFKPSIKDIREKLMEKKIKKLRIKLIKNLKKTSSIDIRKSF